MDWFIRILVVCLLAVLSALIPILPASAERKPDIANTKHNLSYSGPGSVKTTDSSQTQICVFCHTPHGAETIVGAPLWNRKLSTQTYNTYTSSSIEANVAELAAGPGGSSRLCLSCHDGTLALGQVNVFNGSGSPPVFAGLTGSMPVGGGTATGFTRNLGTELGNDHPISVIYNEALVTADGELRSVTAAQRTNETSTNLPSGKTHAVGIRDSAAGTLPLLPLEKAGASNLGQVQCATCHDPHIRDPLETTGIKFLRANRFQKSAGPNGGVFNYDNDIICLACHKPGAAWANSAHAVSSTTQAYDATAAGLREFATGTPVWQAACLNCHDTHTVQGARRLLREGTDSTAKPKTGGGSAIEQTCYQCHQLRTNTASSTPPMVLNLASQTVPDIMTDFTAANSYHMPITSSEQCAGSEKHSIGDTVTDKTARALDGKDFVERPALLGAGAGNDCNRHVECTDCHNPHRVQKGNHAGGGGGTDIRGTANGNNVSNALLGGFGVEPDYTTATDTKFGRLPSFPSTSLRCGSTGSSNCTQVVTKEYQICLKCHSNYAYTDVDDPVGDATATGYNYSGRPTIGQTGTTPNSLAAFQGANSVNVWPSGSKYTNQAMEFWGPDSHKGEAAASHTLTGKYVLPNHRSWHPVMQPTGRTKAERGSTDIDNFQAKFNTNVGTQTMYCTDCHGNATASTTTNDVDANKPWGPHGSTNPFILKGQYNVTSEALCLKCHTGYTASRSGFRETDGSRGGNLHAYHKSKMSGIRCNNCHVAVPHGWKHKALLADTQTVGNEVGLTTETAIGGTSWAKDSTYAGKGYTKGPYYMNAMLKVNTWKRSNNWASTDCNGGVGGMKAACQNQ
jgi:hypothetical protein